MHDQSVAVVGAGAVGCYFGGMLARSGVDVTLIGRAAHMNPIAREGLVLNGLRIHERIAIKATSDMREGLREAAVVLFCVKTVSTESAAHEIAPFLGADTAILSFQNGVDNVGRIHSAIGRHAIPVAVYVAAAMNAPGTVTHNGRGDLVIGYHPEWPLEPPLEPLATMFEDAGVPCKISPSIQIDLWTKMAMNCAYNAISALGQAQYGRIVSAAPARILGERAIAETVAVAQAEGVPLSAPALVQAALELGQKMSGATSSTAQDIARGRATEIDSLNGYISRRGAALGIATPVNDALYALVKLLEESASIAN